MRVRLTTDRSDRGFEQRAGEEIDVDAPLGKRLLQSGQAEIVREAPVEAAAGLPDHVETAARRRTGRR